MIEAALGFLAVFVLAFMRVPLALAMSIVGLAGLGLGAAQPDDPLGPAEHRGAALPARGQ